MPEQSTSRSPLFFLLIAFSLLIDVITASFLATGKISIQRAILLIIMSSIVGLLAMLFRRR